jgi:hypothetical protein
MPGHVRVGGSWKTVSSPSVRVGGSWKPVTAGFTRVGGAWKEWYAAIQPTYELLETQILPSNQASVVFSNLNSSYGSSYQHLQLRVIARGSLNSQIVSMQINGDTGNNYAWHGLAGEIAGGVRGVRSSGGSSQSSIFRASAQGSPDAASQVFGAGIIDILDAFETTKNKTVRSIAGQLIPNDESIAIFSGLYNSTSAINSITLFRSSSSFIAGSRFSLYGIR